MPQPPLVAVVILNWNKAGQTAACVRAVAQQTHAPLTILVVDNGSAAGSLGPLEQLDVPLTLIRNPENRGFTGGVNIGITRGMATGADYVWLLNNDALPEPDTLARLVAAMQANPRIGLASPVIRNADANDEVEFCGGLWDGRRTHPTNEPATYLDWAARQPRGIWLVGTALLLRRGLIDAIGLFDERFFAYWEDVDYSLRGQAAGYTNVVVLDAVVRHASGAPMTDLASKPPHYYYYMARNEMLFLRKHLGWRGGARAMWWALHQHLRRVHQLGAYPAAADAIFYGLRDGLVTRTGEYPAGRRLSAPVRGLLLRASRLLVRPR